MSVDKVTVNPDYESSRGLTLELDVSLTLVGKNNGELVGFNLFQITTKNCFYPMY